MEGEKARKRGWSPSSPSLQNYRLKRTLLMGKRRGSSTPVPAWKMIASRSPSSLQLRFGASAYMNGGNARDFTARELAAVLWEIDRMPSSSTLKSENFGEKNVVEGMAVKQRVMESSKLKSMELGFSDPSLRTVSEGKLCSCRRRAFQCCRKPLRSNHNSGCSVQVDKTQNHATNGLKTNLEDVYNGLTTSKQLVHLLSRVLENPECISSTLVSALGVELDRSCNRVSKLSQGEKKRQKSETGVFPSIVGELEAEKKLRRRSEKLNQKTEAELAETRASLTRVVKELESEKKARRKVEQVCEELARGVWELKRQFGKVREEVEREREMFQIADLLREERVQMKLSDAKCLYEERNALVEKLRNELEASLKGDNKSKELEKLLKDSKQKHERETENDVAGNQIEEESDDSDLHSIELSMEEISKSFIWGNARRNGSKRNSFDTSKGRLPKKQPYVQNQKLQMGLLSQSKQENFGFY